MQTLQADVRIINGGINGSPTAEIYFQPQVTRQGIIYECFCVMEGHNEAVRDWIKHQTHNPKTKDDHELCSKLIAYYERSYNCKLKITPWFKMGLRNE